METSDFKRITPEMVKSVEKMLKNENKGCFGISCSECPFDSSNSLSCIECMPTYKKYAYDTTVKDEILLESCREFMTMIENRNNEVETIFQMDLKIGGINHILEVNREAVVNPLSIIKDFCERKTVKETKLWKATKDLYKLFYLDWR